MKTHVFFVFLFFILTACGDPGQLHFQDDTDAPPETPAGDVTTLPPQAKTLQINAPTPLVLAPGEAFPLTVSGTLTDASPFSNLAKSFNQPWLQRSFPVIWYVNNKSVASVDADGFLIAKNSGKTTLKADLLGASATLEVEVEAPEVPTPGPEPTPVSVPTPAPPPPAKNAPVDPTGQTGQTSQTKPPEPPKADTFENPETDCTIGTDEVLTMNYGTFAGTGQEKYPQVLYGSPKGIGDQLTFGYGGSLLIGWTGCLPVDTQGPDFTVFENPLGPGVFSERGRVSVSADGVTFVEFPCSVDDSQNLYPGCAGVYPPNLYGDSFDPVVSGGDQYDLSTIGVPLVKFILIEDLKTCHKGDGTYPVCATEGKEGFDLDAVVILHGKKE